MTLRRPLLLEGEAGVGKTELAKSLAARPPEASSSASSATRASTPPRPSTTGTTPSSSCTCALRRPPASRSQTTADALEAELYGERFLIKRASASGDRADRGPAARPPHRRGRPGRRRVRGVPARDPLRLPGHRPRGRRVSRPTTPRSSCSPPTAPATCTTRSSVAACTTGSSTPALTARSQSSNSGCRASTTCLAKQVAAAVEGLREPQPLQAAGRRRDHRLGHRPRPAGREADSTTRSSPTHPACTVLKYREDHQRVEQHGIGEVVKQAIEKGLLHA